MDPSRGGRPCGRANLRAPRSGDAAFWLGVLGSPCEGPLAASPTGAGPVSLTPGTSGAPQKSAPWRANKQANKQALSHTQTQQHTNKQTNKQATTTRKTQQYTNKVHTNQRHYKQTHKHILNTQTYNKANKQTINKQPNTNNTNATQTQQHDTNTQTNKASKQPFIMTMNGGEQRSTRLHRP